MKLLQKTRFQAAILFSLLAVLAIALPSSAAAAPSLGVEITHSPTTMPRTDERLVYQVEVKNTASISPVVGDQLFCNGTEPQKNWVPNAPGPEPTFSFEWLRNGVVIPGAAAQTYTTVAADAGTAIQCLVTGTNINAAAKYASLPTIVVGPQPAIQPPQPSDRIAAGSRPAVTGTGTAPRTCAAPANWLPVSPDPNAPTYTFSWLINGVPIAGATTSEYTPVPEDTGKNLQCMVTGTNAGGATVGISNNSAVGTVTQPPAIGVGQNPAVDFSNSTAGALTAILELPAGEDVSVFGVTPNGWACKVETPAIPLPQKVICERANVLGPGAAAPPILVAIAAGPKSPDTLMVKAEASGGGAAAPATAEDTFVFGPAVPWEIKSFATKVSDGAGADYTQAGGHPTAASASFELPTRVLGDGKLTGVEEARNVVTDLPPGFLGNPEAAPQQCASQQDVISDRFNNRTCPPSSIVGRVDIESLATGNVPFEGLALYNMAPERGRPAEFSFAIKRVGFITPVSIAPKLSVGPDGYAITIEAPQVAKNVGIQKLKVELCGFGAKTVLGTIEMEGAPQVTECLESGDPGANPKPFLTNPTECSDTAPVTELAIDSWTHQGDFLTATATAPKVTGCEKVPFAPAVELQPTSSQADSPTGLDVSIELPSYGLETPSAISQAHLKRAVVTLPQGMAVNPSAANGLGACSSADLKLGTNDPVTCPDSSKVGTAKVQTPLLSQALEGSVYIAKQGDNPFKTLLALYLVVESKERGILVKIPGRVDPRPDGQLVATFDDNPQVPFSNLELHFNSGNRAALLNPPKCGTYEITSELTPWSAADPDNPTAAETSTTTSTFTVDSGPGGGPCPTGSLVPKFDAGVTNAVAGTTSPFVLNLSRDDGTQRFSALDVVMPKGLTAYLKGVPYCPDSVLAAIPTAEGTGAAELASPSCPSASRIGSVSVGAGGGTNPFYVSTGKAYLAGPYKGAPISIAIVTPAVAGPFDLGNVVVRNAAFVDPRTAQITVKSDSIPTILHGIPLDVRDIRVSIDRPGFTLAPTSCEESAVNGQVAGTDGASAAVSNRFQVGDCGSLDFRPKLKLEYKGQTKRTGNPALRAVLTQPAGQANIANTQVILPKGSFIDNAHINNPCTRAEYAANACPAKSILGRATAWSPLLDEPLSGNVYFRSNGGERELPDIVAKLQGQVEVELVGYIDSIVNKKTGSSRVRNTFAIVPDAPVSRFVLQMKGGKLGLIENSKNLCKQKNRATVKMGAHNGLALTTEPVVKTSCGKKKNGKKRKK